MKAKSGYRWKSWFTKSIGKVIVGWEEESTDGT